MVQNTLMKELTVLYEYPSFDGRALTLFDSTYPGQGGLSLLFGQSPLL